MVSASEEGLHPEWTAEDDAAGREWGPELSSYAVDDGERLLLIDPTIPPAALLDLASDRETVIVLTSPFDGITVQIGPQFPAAE